MPELVTEQITIPDSPTTYVLLNCFVIEAALRGLRYGSPAWRQAYMIQQGKYKGGILKFDSGQNK
jgi:hypothetical protein